MYLNVNAGAASHHKVQILYARWGISTLVVNKRTYTVSGRTLLVTTGVVCRLTTRVRCKCTTGVRNIVPNTREMYNPTSVEYHNARKM